MSDRASHERPPGRSVLQLGEHRITPLSDGRFRLDGGAMFGVVPRVLWERMVTPDERNRIPLALRPFLIEGPYGRILIEPGIGSRWNEKEIAQFAIDHGPLPEDGTQASAGEGRAGEVVANLAELGLAPGDIDVLVLTHCHWDHCGAAVQGDDEVGLEVTFPNARVVAPDVELRAASNPEHVRRGSYRREDVEPLLDACKMEPVASGNRHSIAEGVELLVLDGHSEGVSIVEIRGGGAKAVFWSDVIPTSNHVHPHFIMAYDMNAERSYQVRRPLIERAAEERWIGLYYHDPAWIHGRIRREGRRYVHEALDPSDPVFVAGEPA